MITVKRKDDRSLEVINGHSRLRMQLELTGKAKVVEIISGETLFVHEVGGLILALQAESQAAVEAVATEVILNASRK